MRQKLICIAVIIVLITGVVTQLTFAQGLLGERYIVLSIGQTNPGDEDIEEIDDSIFQLGGSINLPVNQNIDAVFSYSYAKLDGNFIDVSVVEVETTARVFVGGINYHFTPDKKTNPFVGIRIGFFSGKTTEDHFWGFSESHSEDGFAVSVSSGVEINLSDQVAILPAIEYDKLDDEDDFITSVSLSIWFNEFILGGLATSYAFDNGDVSYSVGLGYGF